LDFPIAAKFCEYIIVLGNKCFFSQLHCSFPLLSMTQGCHFLQSYTRTFYNASELGPNPQPERSNFFFDPMRFDVRRERLRDVRS